ncbi:hypothetical protein FTO70_14525 [Methanosarcina sp. KYL-1]|uniref:hypothetical protein n=1 Tax=Methanosarcina sp. KYL-1 TaxID=2602068 RepID=UPI002100F41F|nr:hypothetical protein [Methanosarcina sp. KYL-1]MCQ1536863.1 hypothetical protein [Methanosarcina sp. KYL-1]
MALDRTSGFDLLVQVSENELNNQLATAFLAGDVLPPSMSAPVDRSGVVGTFDMNFNTPVADLDRPRPSMGLTVPFANSQFRVTAPITLTLAPLGGTITIVDRIEMITQGSNQIATMDFNNGAPTVMVAFDTASQAILTPVLDVTGLTLEQVQNMMAGIILQQLQTGVGRIDLTPPIPVVNDTDPTTIFDIDVTTVNDTTATDRDCITFGVRMANDSGGNINGVTTSFIPAGSQSLVMMSNFWLLARVMRPRLAASLGRPVTDFDTPLRLNRSIPAPGGQGTLTQLEARVEGNRIRVNGQARDSGTGWSAMSNFTFFIDIALVDGSLSVTATTPTVDTNVDLEWWVWLLTLGLGALFGGIIGTIVTAIVLAIVEAVAEGIIDNLVGGGIGDSLGGLPAIPLGPIGGGLTLSTVVLDDMELRCSITRSLSVPVKNQGSHLSSTGFNVDLDTGTIRSSVLPETDLVWNPSRGLSANGPTGLSVIGTSFSSLTPVQVSNLPLLSREIPLTLIPFTYPPSTPFVEHDEVVFGVRTTDGRYAKARAWRSLTAGGALQLSWVTYDTPVPRLDIAARWWVIERGEVTEFIRPDCSVCRSSPVRWCGMFEAWPRLMAFPIDYQWCLCGKVLEEGEGSVSTPHGPLAYKLTGRCLCIETEMEQDVDCELCVSAIDSRGQELFTCTRLVQQGIETRCMKCVPKAPYMKLEVIPADPALNAWRPLIAARTMKTQDQDRVEKANTVALA